MLQMAMKDVANIDGATTGGASRQTEGRSTKGFRGFWLEFCNIFLICSFLTGCLVFLKDRCLTIQFF